MKKCIGCGKNAITNTGHIHTEIGTITAGWCQYGGSCAEKYVPSNITNYCQSVNKHSCYGEFKLSDIELREPLTTENLIRHSKGEAFSRMVDAQLHNRGNIEPVKIKKSWIERIFGD